MDVIDKMAAWWLPWMLWTSLQTLGLSLLVGLVCLCLPRLSASVRCSLWWLVGLHVLLSVGWRLSLAWPWPHPSTYAWIPPDLKTSIDTTVHHVSAMPLLVSAADQCLRLLFAMWILNLTVQLLSVGYQLGQTWCLRRHLTRVDTHVLHTLTSIQARNLGIKRIPALLTSHHIHSPRVMGLFHPAIVLPSQPPLPATEAAMVIAHELAHIRRGDLWLGWVPSLAYYLLPLHPGLRWSRRAYQQQRESACDALALSHCRDDSMAYGRLLLRWPVGLDPAGQIGIHSRSSNELQYRLRHLQQERSPRRHHRWQTGLALGLVLLGVMPYRFSYAVNPPPPVIAPVITPRLPHPPPVIIPARPQPASPITTAPPLATAPPAPMQLSARSKEQAAWGVFDGHTAYFQGQPQDQITFAKVQQPGQALLWYRRGSQVFVSHDPTLIRQTMQRMQSTGPSASKHTPVAVARPQIIRQQWLNAQAQSALASQQMALASAQASAHRHWVEQLWQPQLQHVLGSDPRHAASAASIAAPNVAMQKLQAEQQQLQQQMAKLAQRQQRYATQTAATATATDDTRGVQPLLEQAIRQGRASPLRP